MIFKLILSLSFEFLSLQASAADSDRRLAVMTLASPYYKTPNVKSPVLGSLPKGERTYVFYPSKNGFYAIYLKKTIQHSHYGWIPAQAINISNVSFPAPSTLETRRDEIGVFARYFSFSPNDYETAAGGVNTSVKPVSIGLSYTHRMTRSWLWEVQANYYSANPVITGNSATSIFFNFSGFDITVNFERAIIDSGDFSLWIGAGVGFSTNSFTSPPFLDPNDNTQFKQLKASSLTAFPLIVKVQARYSLPEDFGAYLDLGYEKKSIGPVPYSTNLDGTNNSTTFLMDSPFLALGLTYAL